MKRFALLRLEHGSNKVIADFTGTLPDAIQAFRGIITNAPPLDDTGYCKVSETVSLCVAEYHQQFCSIN
jgi:hypothetical protein